jgi:hypothetical protein
VASTETAVTRIEQSVDASMVEWTLDEFPVGDFNRLIPTQTLMVPTDLLRPVVQVVQLNPDPDKGGDVYHSNDMPDGHAAPTKVALRKFATAAGISFVDERRTDDGTDPNVIEVTCWAEMLLPTGQRLRAVGQKRIDLEAQAWRSPQHRAKYKSFFLEHVASRAENRAIRALLSLRGSYPLSVYTKPFAVVSFAPNMNHPEVRARILDAMAPAVGALYGPSEQKALAAGKPIDVTPAAEEDPAPDKPTQLPGEKLAAAGTDEPDWLKATPATPAHTAPAERKPENLATTIRNQAADSTQKGKATKPQLEKLAEVFEGIDRAKVGIGIVALFGPEARQELRSAEANALIVVHDAFGPQDTWAEAWTAMADATASAAA